MKKLIHIILLILLFSCNNNQKSIDLAEKKQENIYSILNADSTKTYKYNVVKVEDFSIPNARRISVRANVPAGLDSTDLLNTAKSIIAENYLKYKPITISVLMYSDGDDVNQTYTAGMSDFAPYGEWTKANDKISINSFRMTMNYNSRYFN